MITVTFNTLNVSSNNFPSIIFKTNLNCFGELCGGRGVAQHVCLRNCGNWWAPCLCTVNKEPHGRRKQTWRYCRSLCPELLMSPDRGPGPRTKHRSPGWRTILCRNRFEHNGRSAFSAVTMCHKHCHLRGPSSHYHIIICSRPISP